jgi:hypothetical protein
MATAEQPTLPAFEINKWMRIKSGGRQKEKNGPNGGKQEEEEGINFPIFSIWSTGGRG